jgi:serine protease
VSEPANCPGVIGVAGLRHVGTKVGFSDIGPEIAISAPGGNCVNDITLGLPCLYPILTTSNSGTTVPHAGGSIYTDSFNYSLGTSFSSPLVAGAVALMLSAQPALTPAQVRSLIQSSSRAFPPSSSDPAVPVCAAPTGVDQDECHCTSSTCGAGMLDAGAAVRAALSAPPPPQVTSVSNPTATEGSSLVYTVALSNGAADVTTFPFTLGGGSASASDYGAPTFSSGVTLAGGTLTVPAGVTSFTITLPTTQDTLSESNETVPLAVGSATGTGTIVDDDPTPAATPPAATSSGGGGAVGSFWLTLLAGAVLALRSVAPRRRCV